METIFILICGLMTGLLVWGIGWYYLLATGFATIFMITLYKLTDPS